MQFQVISLEFRESLRAWGVPAASAFAAFAALDRWPDWRLAGDPVGPESVAAALVVLGCLPAVVLATRPLEACRRITRHAAPAASLALSFAAAHSLLVACSAIPGLLVIGLTDVLRGDARMPAVLVRLVFAFMLIAPWAGLLVSARALAKLAGILSLGVLVVAFLPQSQSLPVDVPFFVDQCLRRRILDQLLTPHVFGSAIAWSFAGLAMSWLALSRSPGQTGMQNGRKRCA
jgi:hypothetical protein